MRIAVAGIVLIKGTILIGKKVEKPGHFVSGGWHIPGGHVQDKENKINALKREYLEETGLEIKILKKITYSKIMETDCVVHWYLCENIKGNPIAGDDLSEIKLVPKDNVLNECDRRAVKLWPKKVIEYFTV